MIFYLSVQCSLIGDCEVVNFAFGYCYASLEQTIYVRLNPLLSKQDFWEAL